MSQRCFIVIAESEPRLKSILVACSGYLSIGRTFVRIIDHLPVSVKVFEPIKSSYSSSRLSAHVHHLSTEHSYFTITVHVYCIRYSCVCESMLLMTIGLVNKMRTIKSIQSIKLIITLSSRRRIEVRCKN